MGTMTSVGRMEDGSNGGLPVTVRTATPVSAQSGRAFLGHGFGPEACQRRPSVTSRRSLRGHAAEG